MRHGDVIYIVKAGDTLWSIAKRFAGDGKFYHYLRVKRTNRNMIYPGDHVTIPAEILRGVLQ